MIFFRAKSISGTLKDFCLSSHPVIAILFQQSAILVFRFPHHCRLGPSSFDRSEIPGCAEHAVILQLFQIINFTLHTRNCLNHIQTQAHLGSSCFEPLNRIFPTAVERTILNFRHQTPSWPQPVGDTSDLLRNPLWGFRLFLATSASCVCVPTENEEAWPLNRNTKICVAS